jgi:glycerate kinase
MRILLASDKFKGALPSPEVAAALRLGLAEVFPGAEFDTCPIADGGEGTTEAMVAALGGTWVETGATDAQGRPRAVRFGWVAAERRAILEMSAASGLALVSDLPLAPERASTGGTGELLQAARALGAERILIGIGGSATNDGGLGMALALGHRFERAGAPFSPTLETLLEADRLQPAPRVFAEVLVACDVDNPLLGPHGATRVYGPQKGVRDFDWFERRLAHLADLAAVATGTDPRDLPGAGAAGGLGFGLMAFAGGRLTPGFDLVAGQIGLADRVARADLVVTGEGRLDEQSLQGKGPVGVARLARAHGKPVLGVAGAIADSAALRAQFDLLLAIKPAEMPLAEAMRRTAELLTAAIRAHAPELRALRPA